MTDSTLFKIGADVACKDGACGSVSRVVVDPIARTVTHLVVEPKHRVGLGRLVPVTMVAVTNGDLLLDCTQEAFDALANAEETEYLPGLSEFGGYGHGEVLYLPFFGLANGGFGTGQGSAQLVTHDSIPAGDVAIRRGEQVHATDGEIGRVQGLVIDPENHHVTHVLLQEGHLWGRKEVAIPLRFVTGLENGIRLNLTIREVADLPSVDLDHVGKTEAR
jgi:sporulation protein YlmC with PRC-barrel domain